MNRIKTPKSIRRSSAYKYRRAGPSLLLEDLDLPYAVSITNNAEQVVDDMLIEWRYLYAGDPAPRILYRDTTGRWDELKHDGEKFIGFAPIDPETRQLHNLIDENVTPSP